MENLEIMGVQEMDAKEMREGNGGISIIKITGLLDGVKGNTKLYLFGKLILG
jgi:hypothetical protein